MKRVFMAALCCAALFAFSHARAQAMIEFCPATLHVQPVREATTPANRSAAALYGFNLSAMGPRSVNVTLAFDTSAGWFEVDVPQVVLAEKDRHYTSISAMFVRRDFVSPIMYVRFPTTVALKRSWVRTATAQDDGPFGWEKQGQVTCDPPIGARASQNGAGEETTTLDPKDGDKLGELPSAGSQIMTAKETVALEPTECAIPFAAASATKPVDPSYPYASPRGVFETAIEVAIDANGAVVDAWVWGPSGDKNADDVALNAAEESKYKAGRAYCKDVPGLYLFRVTSDPNG